MSSNDRGIESGTQGHRFAASGTSIAVPTMCWCSVSNYVCGHVPLVRSAFIYCSVYKL